MRNDPSELDPLAGRWWWAVVAIAATSCGGKTDGPIAIANRSAEPPPAVVLIVADHSAEGRSRVRFVATTRAGLVTTRTIALPADVAVLAWVGPEPVVMLVGGEHEGEVGRISSTGYEPFAAVPVTLSSVPRPSASSEHLDTPKWRLTVEATGAVWQGRCDWGYTPHAVAYHGAEKDGWCDAWVDARVWPGPITISHVAPSAAPERELPVIPPPTTTKVEIVTLKGSDKTILRCTQADKTIEYPPEDQRDSFLGVHDLTWLATAPPMFRIVETLGAPPRPSVDMPVMFEGCELSPDYASASVVVGPHDLSAIVTYDKVSVRQRGKELGTLSEISLLRFAP
jgi:hypothetical protein